MKISACVVLYEDPEILRSALTAIEHQVDQIVVVDGPYDWMLPFLPQPEAVQGRSSAACLDVLAEFQGGGRLKYCAGIWKNELEKRQFAYESCDHPLVYLVDADEVCEVDPLALNAFLCSGKGVAGLSAPLLVTDRIIQSTSPVGQPPVKPALFRKDRISARQHLSYLWLVLPASERAQCVDLSHDQIWPTPVGINYHLSTLRSLEGGVTRARFYMYNWMREAKFVPWLRNRKVADLDEMKAIMAAWPPGAMDRNLMGRDVALGFSADPSWRYFPFTPSANVAPTLRLHFSAFRASMDAAVDVTPDTPRILFNDHAFHLDITDRLPADGTDIRITLVTDKVGLVWRLSVGCCFLGDDAIRWYRLDPKVEGTQATVVFQPPSLSEKQPFRSLLCVELWWPKEDDQHLVQLLGVTVARSRQREIPVS